MSVAEQEIPQKPEPNVKAIVAQLADDVAVHGYQVTTHTVGTNHERKEETVTVVMKRQFGGDQQQVIDLREPERKRGRRSLKAIDGATGEPEGGGE